MPRWLAHSLLVLGWLLTPVWAWAASNVGLWLGAVVALRFQNPFIMLAIAGTGALLFGFAVLWIWITFMRHLPHLLSHRMAPRDSAGIESGSLGTGAGAGSGHGTAASSTSGARRSEKHAAIAAAD